MSAIWGCVDLTGAALPPQLGEEMERPLREYRIDRYAHAADRNVVMGCGIQHIYPESEKENLPVLDEERGLSFTADCALDNRPELIGELCPGETDIPDGALLYLAYLKWREDTSRHVIGSYAYAVYDKRENRLLLSADHTQTRSIYYLRQGNLVFFGTLIESVLRGRGGPPALNEEWVTMFLAMVPITNQADPTLTPYAGLKRVTASKVRLFSEQGDKEVCFWSPEQVKPLRLANDDAYRARFREILDRSARDVLRGVQGETGILLSSGMDSSTVAAVVSPVLREQGRKLHAYTNVPLKGYVQQYRAEIVTDESAGVRSLCEMHPNILPNFMDCPGVDGFNAIPELLPMHELPYKSLTNLAWINDLERQAAADGCRVLLSGQMGNATVSWGDMQTYVKTTILRGHPFRAWSALNRYARLLSISRKRQIKFLLGSFMPRALWRLTNRDYFRESFVNPRMAESLGIGRTDSRLEMNAFFPTVWPYRKNRMHIFNVDAFAHIADADTKLALKHGLLMRDLTRDIRMFEFCIAAPMACFVNGEPATRRCVRAYMKDALPAAMLAENAPRGRQSGDWLFRIEPRWPQLYEEIAQGCRAQAIRPYVDGNKVEETLEKIKEGPAPRDEYEFMRLGAVYLMSRFLQSRTWETPKNP